MIPAGLYYIPNYLTKAELTKIKKELTNSEKWYGISGNPKSRKVIQYGYSYSYAYDRTGVEKIDDMPEIFSKLITKDKVNKAVKNEVMTDEMEQLIINEYLPGQGIAFHTDHEKYFGPVIVCITVGSGISIDFVHRYDDTKKYTQYVEEGSLYIMSGDARYKWKHGIAQRISDNDKERGIRWSLTYRTVVKENIYSKISMPPRSASWIVCWRRARMCGRLIRWACRRRARCCPRACSTVAT